MNRSLALSTTALLLLATSSKGGEVCGEWEFVPTFEPFDTTQLHDVAVIAEDDAWAVGYTSNQTLAMHWDGEEWTIVPTPNPSGSNNKLRAVAALASDNVWAAGNARLPNPPFGFVHETALVMHWDGESWEVIDNPQTPDGMANSWVRDIEIISEDDIWFAGDYGGGFLTMHWDGSGLDIIPTPTFPVPCGGTFGCGHGLESIAAVASDDVWAVGGGSDGDSSSVSQIIHWDGAQWTHIPGPSPGPWHRLYDVAPIASDNVWVVGLVEPAEIAGILLNWDGEQWNEMPTPETGGYGTLAVLGPNDIWAGGGTLLMHYDGADWTTMPAEMHEPGDITGRIRSSAKVGDCDVWMVGQANLSPHHPFIQRLQPTDATSADLDGDGAIAFSDLLMLLAAWGPCDAPCAEDLDSDGNVAFSDLLILLANWT